MMKKTNLQSDSINDPQQPVKAKINIFDAEDSKVL